MNSKPQERTSADIHLYSAKVSVVGFKENKDELSICTIWSFFTN
jgi:hypothetical protein